MPSPSTVVTVLAVMFAVGAVLAAVNAVVLEVVHLKDFRVEGERRGPL